MRKVGLLILGLLMLSISGCATMLDVADARKDWLSAPSGAVNITYDMPQVVVFKEVPYHVYLGPDSTLWVRNGATGKESQVYQAPKNMQLSSLAVYADANQLYIAWRPKLSQKIEGFGGPGDKMVFVARSADGSTFEPAVRVSSANGAFAPRMTGSGNGDVYVVWQDERSGSAYDLYFNVSHDFGKTWKSEDVRVDFNGKGETFSAEPALIAHGRQVSVVWTESPKSVKPNEGFPVSLRTSSDAGETWGSPVEAAKPSRPALYPQGLRLGEKIYVYWFNEVGIGGTWSADAGATWNTVQPIAGEIKARSLVARADRLGGIHLVYGHMGDSDKYNNLYHTYSQNGVDFSTPVPLNDDDGGFTYSAVLATIDIDELSNVLVAWMDYRYFRPIIMGKYSKDHGQTWSPSLLLSRGPDTNATQFAQVRAVGTEWWASMVQYPQNANPGMGSPRLTQIRMDKTGQVPNVPVNSVQALKDRASAWWQTRVDADWSRGYDYLDPVMRSAISRPAYVASQGSTKYYNFEVLDVELSGIRKAKVRVKFTFEVPQLSAGIKPVSVPKRETTAEQEWIYVDGDWFVLYKDIYGKSFFE